MFDLEKQIKAWRRELTGAGVRSPEVLEELENHLREQTALFVSSGWSEREAFQGAVRQLGDTEVLNKEFSKVNRHRFGGYRNNPLALKILAASFILAGIDPLVTSIRVWIQGIITGERPGINLTLALVSVIWAVRVFIGIGLLRRSNAWRMVALIWSGIAVMAIPALYFYILVFPQNSMIHNVPTPTTDFFMGLTVPFKFTMGVYFLNLAIMAWGLYTLNKTSVRNLFRPATAN